MRRSGAEGAIADGRGSHEIGIAMRLVADLPADAAGVPEGRSTL
jgi:hypothetical protein